MVCCVMLSCVVLFYVLFCYRGDFNHADLKAVLPKFYQHVKRATRGANTLHKVYSNIKLGYRARPLPHLGQTDHMSLLLIPAYAPLRKTAPTITKSVKIWPDSTSQQLQDCFDRMNWDIFEHPDLEVFTDSVLCYIKNCIDTVTVDKRIQVYPNQKPWMTREVQRLLRERNTAFREASERPDFRRRIEDHLNNNNSRQLWQGVRHLTNYRANLGAAVGDATLAEELNLFFACFDVEPPEIATVQPMVHSSFTLTAEEHEVRCMLWAVNPRKAVGPDGIPGHVLKDYVDQLAGVFTMIFNQSLSQSTVPPCLKSSTIIPLPKKPHISSLNDYRPVALTPVVMKCFEKHTTHHVTPAPEF
ncbi:hypothetical protein QTP86_020708 [Hemibagrus guttatus]|nr:hypothetical protein QTP86_020708 [Hemibagrus guttatus]